ncbi:MAG: alpha/beta fold hydrolase [Thiohalocapsa sp.]
MATVRLHVRRYGDAPDATPLVLLHGLFGSSANWHGIARRLAQRRPVLVPDLRNHGQSPHDPLMAYALMADDLLALLEREGVERAIVVGHSMGGKAAMCLTLRHPERVEAVGVVDIAPVVYPSGFETLIDALIALPLQDVTSRGDADRRLRAAIPDPSVRGYLLQNLRRDGDAWDWRFNLSSIAAGLPAIRGFPDEGEDEFAGPALFLYGTGSDYVGADALAAIRRRFPLARLRAIANAGHWVYAEQPDAFVAALEAFIRKL